MRHTTEHYPTQPSLPVNLISELHFEASRLRLRLTENAATWRNSSLVPYFTKAPPIGVPTRVATAVGRKNVPMRAPSFSMGTSCATAAEDTEMKIPEKKPEGLVKIISES